MSQAASRTDGQPAQPGVLALFRDPNYLNIWVVGGLSGVMRWLQLLAMGIFTFEVTSSPLLVSLVTILWMLPLTLGGPAIGVLADRFDRKLLLGGAIVMVMAVAIVMAVIAYGGNLAFIHIAIASVFSGLFWAADMPVRRRLLGDLSRGALAPAMSLDAATGNATRMAGPLLGGVMLQLVGMTGVFALSAAVYAVCLVLVVLVRLPERRDQPTVAPAFLRDMAAGVRFVMRNRPIRRILSVTIVFNMFGFPFTAMIPVLGKDRLGLDPFMVGVLSSLEGFGAFIGAMLVAVLARPENFFRIYFWGTLLYLGMIFYLSILSYVSGGPYHSFIAASLALTVIGIASACFSAMQGTLSYLAAPPEYRSRVLGVLTLCIGSGPVGFFNVGWMAEAYGVSTALFIISAEGLVMLFVIWAFSRDGEPDPGAYPTAGRR